MVAFILELIFESVRVDWVNHRTHNICMVLCYPLEQRLQPSLSHFTMRVQECQHLTRGMVSPKKSPSVICKHIFNKTATVLLYLINPTLSLDLITFTLPQAIKCSSSLLKCGNVEPSSTKITSLQNHHFNQLEIWRPFWGYLRSLSGDLLITECTVLSKVDQASLWNVIMTVNKKF